MSLAEKIKKEFPDFDLILSPAMGGVIIGYEIGKTFKKRDNFFRKSEGEFQLRRDFKIKKNSKVINNRRCYNNW